MSSQPGSNPRPAVFLSYAREDAEATRRLAEALRTGGIEVWFDENELRGGDEWDRSIRKQIRDCALFLPVISANTQTRTEGYFRLEWHLAEQRSLLMAKGRPFVVPVCVDATAERDALVPDAFLAVQWTRLVGGEASSAFVERVRGLLNPISTRPPTRAAASPAPSAESGPSIPDYELRRMIGRGSYGDVWLACGVTGVWRAIKIVWRARFADAGPFEREFKGLKEFAEISLGESMQMALLHVGRNDAAGFFYYVMELADDAERGRTIEPAGYVPLTFSEMHRRRGRVAAGECVKFGVELARVLAGLHARGLVHRDIKPSNVILVNGVPKLADIGLVAPVASARSFVGTEGYVPPEGPGSPGADVFALGKVLYELSTGLDREEFPKLPSNLNRLTDRETLLELNEIILRACETRPELRYGDGGALLADLQSLHGGRSMRTRRVFHFALRAAAGLVAVGAIAAAVRWKYFSGAPPIAARATAPTVVPLSEARRLAVRARALTLDKYDSTPEDFAVADGLIKRALELDSNDAEVWTVSSLLNNSFDTRGFDHSPSRNATAHSHAERALTLAPDSLEALFALARWQRDNEDPAIAEQTFQKILARDPNHGRALNSLATLLERHDRPDEAAALYERNAALPGQAALARYTEFLLYFHRSRFEEAEKCIRQSIDSQPSANSQAGLAQLLLTWKGDADGAARVLLSGLTAARSEPRTIWTTAMVQLCQRAPEDVLKTLSRFSGDYIQDNWFAGPPTYFAGRAHAMAGRMSAAHLAWETGLIVVDTRLKETAQSRSLHLMRGELLALLDRSDDALREARTLEELSQRREEAYWFGSSARIYALLGRADDALPLLSRQLERSHEGKDVGWPLTPALLRIDPLWDKIRNDLRFQKLAASDQPAADAGTPRDWPRDPDLKRARQLIYPIDGIAEDFALADDLVKPLLASRPNDPEVVTVAAEVALEFLVRGFDQTQPRRAQAQRLTERAVQLAPENPNALAALGRFLTGPSNPSPPQLGRAEELLRHAIALNPNEARFHRSLYNILALKSAAEADAYGARMMALFPNDPLVAYDIALHYTTTSDLAAAEEWIDKTLALGPVVNAILWKAKLRLEVHGDVEGMTHWLERVPERQRRNARMATMFAVQAAVTGQTAPARRVLNAIADTWLTDANYLFPKALLLGDLEQVDAHDDVARLEYEAALKEVRSRQAVDPADLRPQRAELWVQIGLGHRDEARAALRINLQLRPQPYRWTTRMVWWSGALRAALLLDERAQALALLKEACAEPQGRLLLRNLFHVDPKMAPFRADSEIVTLLAEP